MKKVLDTPASLVVLDAGGASYGLAVNSERASVSTVIVLSDGASYAVPVLDKTLVNLIVLGSTGNSFSVSTAVRDSSLDGVLDKSKDPQLRMGYQFPWSAISEVKVMSPFLWDICVISTEYKFIWTLPLEVKRVVSLEYDVLSYEAVSLKSRFPYSINGILIQQIHSIPVLTIEGREVVFDSANLSIDEGTSFWIGSIYLSNIGDYASTKVGDKVKLSFKNDVYSLVIDGKSMTRSKGASTTLLLSAMSPLALLDNPFSSNNFTVTYPVATSARQVVTDMVGAVSWKLADWLVPVGQLSFTRTTRFAIAKLIVESIGGVIECLADGTVLCRKAHPVSVPAYAKATPAFVLSDDVTFEIREAISPTGIVNSQLIYNDQMDSGKDESYLEYTATTKYSGIVRAYPVPFRDVLLEHTGNPATKITKVGAKARIIEDEQVEIVEGCGTARYAISELNSITWNANVLGAITYDGRSITTAIKGNSLIKISYEVVSIDFNVEGNYTNDCQFVLKEIT